MGYGIARKPKNMGQAIRFFCLECMGGHDAFVDPKGTIWEAYMPYGAVKNCCDLKCHLFEYRFGKRPVRSAKSTEGVLRAPVEAAQHRRTRRNLTDVNMSAGD